MSAPFIQVKSLTKSYGKLQVLKGIDLEVEKSEVVSIVGASGAGKSTFLQILGTLDTPDSGQIFINGKETTKLRGNELAKFRNQNLGFVFQFHHLLPEFTALENVCIPAFIAGKSKAEAEERATGILNFLGLSNRLHHKPNELSGGEQQRVAVARALINNPDLILADEPSGNLDSKNAKELHQLLFGLREKFNQTIIIVTHNTELAELSDRCLLMRDGKFV